MTMDKKTTKCCICGREFTGWGNNPWPVKTEGECCYECNMRVVVPARIARVEQNKTK